MNQADDEIKTKEPDEVFRIILRIIQNKNGAFIKKVTFKLQVKLTPLSPDKSSMDGQWKKKKGPAPPRPIPPKRQVKKLPRKAVNNELMEIGKTFLEITVYLFLGNVFSVKSPLFQ